MNNTHIVARSAAIITIGYSISRILGYVRLKALAYIFGSNYQTDAYVASFMVPDLLYFLLSGGALTAAFIPVFTEYITKEKQKEAYLIASTVANLMVILICIGIIIIELFAPYFIKIVVPGFDKKTSSLCAYLIRIIAPMVIFTSLSALLSGILHSHRYFIAPAVAYIFYDIPIIAATFIAGKTIGIVGVSIGVLIGACLLVLIQLPAVMKRRFIYFPKIALSHEGVKRIIKLFLPATLGLAISQINLFIIPKVFGSNFPGAPTYLEYTIRIIMLPFGIFAMAISTAVFPTLSIKVAKNKIQEFANTLSRGLTSTLFFSVSSSIGLIILSKPIIMLLYFGGEFNIEDVNKAAYILSFFAAGLVGLSAIQVITRGFYSMGDTKTPLLVGIFSLLVNILLCYSLPKTKLSYGGLSLACSITFIINPIILFIILQFKIVKINMRMLSSALIKIFVAGSIMASVCYLLLLYLSQYINTTNLYNVGGITFLLVIISSIIYGLISLLLRIEEIYIILEIIKESAILPKFFTKFR